MKKIKRILFPTDFSESAVSSFRYALLLADQLEAQIELLHVVYPQGEPMDLPVLVASSTQIKIEIIQKRLLKFVEDGISQVLEQLKNTPDINRNIEIGTPVQAIAQLAQRSEVDLIVIGSRGENRSRIDKWLGSVAAGVVKKSLCPVLVVPEHQEFESIELMAYASDMHDADPLILWRATQLLHAFNPVVYIVHVFEQGKKDPAAVAKLEEMKMFFKDSTPGAGFKIFNLEGNVLKDELKKFLDHHQVNLLVMFQPRHTFWDRLFESSTKEMAYYTQRPLLVMPEK